VTVGDLKPDLTLVLDVPAEVGLKRAGKRRGQRAADRFEAESRSFHEELRQAYRLLAAAEPGRCVLIDATAPKSAEAERIWAIVSERLDPAAAEVAVAGAAP
jgi:dTMP kinase